MDDRRNILTAFLLSALILIGWSFVQERFFPTPQPVTAPAAAPATSGQVAGPVVPAAPGAPAASPASIPSAAAPPRTLAAALAGGNRIPITAPRVSGSINLVGARVDDLTLTRYRQTIDKTSPPVRLFAPEGTPEAYYATVGWSGQGIALPGPTTLWTASGTALTPATPVTLSWANGTGQTFRIEYRIDDAYLITTRQSVVNASAAPVAVADFATVQRRQRPGGPDGLDSWTVHIGPMGGFGGAADYGTNYDDLDEGATPTFQNTDWIGFTDKYWLAAIVPAGASGKGAGGDVAARMAALPGNGGYQLLWARPQVIVPAGKALTTTAHIFAGAKEARVLAGYENDLGIAQLERAIDWGWFYWFEKPIFWLLETLFGLFGNFGLAIIALTVIVRAIMFPIAQRQFRSMAQMRVVQPKLKALQEKYKDDKPQLQQKMMELYKTEKVNPVAGCLPILLQIPVFYALYKVLMITIEMRHQPFFGWIKDLSVPDPAKILNLFGLLPFDPPSFLGIGVLAVLLGVTMWLQFKLNPPMTDPVQAQVFALMPWVLMFVMAPFAAGFLIYWITNNILTIAQQKWLYSRYPGLAATPDPTPAPAR